MSIPESWAERAPRLSTIAAWINEHTTLFAEFEPGYCSTDRKIPGTRLVHPGKGRRGTKLKVFVCEDHKWELVRMPCVPFRDDPHERKHPAWPLLVHNSAEWYRRNSEVVSWLRGYLEQHPDLLRKEDRR